MLVKNLISMLIFFIVFLCLYEEKLTLNLYLLEKYICQKYDATFKSSN